MRYIDPSGNAPIEMGSVGGGGVPAAAPVIRSWNELLYVITAGVVSGTKVVADTQTAKNDKNRERYITLYHGTSAESALDIHKNGIELSKQRAKTDFGKGFYVTADLKQAQEWAGKSGLVLVFKVKDSELRSFNGLIFTKADNTWENFVRYNRNGGKLHNFDYVEGPMLGNPKQFAKGEKAKAWGHQLSIHTQEMIDWLEDGLQSHFYIGTD